MILITGATANIGGATLPALGALVDESTVLPTVPEVLGRPAGTFEAWAQANAGAFARG
jgi:hypothetical protein